MKQALYILIAFILYCWSAGSVIDIYSRRHEVEEGTYQPYFNVLKLFQYESIRTKFYTDFCLANTIHVMTELYFCYLLMKWCLL